MLLVSFSYWRILSMKNRNLLIDYNSFDFCFENNEFLEGSDNYYAYAKLESINFKGLWYSENWSLKSAILRQISIHHFNLFLQDHLICFRMKVGNLSTLEFKIHIFLLHLFYWKKYSENWGYISLGHPKCIIKFM